MRIHAGILVLAAWGCSSELPPVEEEAHLWNPKQEVSTEAVALTTFTGATACADLEQHLEDRAVLQMRLEIEQNKRSTLSSWDWMHQPRDAGPTWADAGSAAGGGTGTGGGSGSSASGGGAGSSAGPTDYTQTNNQVAGIEEPDIIKNDGTRLFVLSGRRLFTVTTWPAASLATRGSLAIEGKPSELLLRGDRLIVFSTSFDPAFGAPSYCTAYYDYCQSWYSNATIVTHVDVSDLANPVIVATQRVPGRYESARQVGKTVRLVTTSTLLLPEGLQTWISYDRVEQAPSRAALARMYDRLADSNETLLRARTLASWIPQASLWVGTAATVPPLACDQIATTNVSAQLGLTNIVTLDLEDPLLFSRQGLLAAVDELYQGPDSLYLSQRHWWWWGNTGPNQTYLYRFDLSQPDRVNFVAAGRIEGMPLNQFSFDERNGVLRVATTVTTWQDFWAQRVNRVVTLATTGTTLTELGRTDDLAPGEQIMSARFIGDRAYVVTFRQVDPLYVIDLSDPAHPTKLGELKIPGFSSYLHPLDATHLLTIGTYIPEVPTTWRERHLQLQIFDVSDPRNPRQTHTQLVGQAWGWSEAQWNHKAFNYFPAKGLLAVPFADWYQDELTGQWTFVSDLRVFHVDATTGFVPKGTLAMDDLLRLDSCSGYSCWNWYWQPMVRRSVMADDYVYAIASGGVRVAHISDLGAPLASAPFPPAP